jgi:hypothetical protein
MRVPPRLTETDLKCLIQLAKPWAGEWAVTNSQFVSRRVSMTTAARLRAMKLVDYWTEYPTHTGGKSFSFVQINAAGRAKLDEVYGPGAGGKPDPGDESAAVGTQTGGA